MMTDEGMLTMASMELARLHVVRKVLDRTIRQVEAARALALSTRQVKRIVARVRREGDRGVIHRSRGRPSNHRIDSKVKDRVLRFYKLRYSDFGPTLAQEKLSERHKIRLSDETLRLWLRQAGMGYKTRKRKPNRQWRERRACLGEMVQMDGSHHDWLEGRGPWMVLMGYIDDATNAVYARFYGYEGTLPAMDSFGRYARRYGLPLSVYLDKHSTYKVMNAQPTVDEQLEGREGPRSQFERALKELGVEVIHANSPQAKGRVERLFGVLQDRLVKEMRLAGVKSREEANRFLESYLAVHNRRFRREPRRAGDLHRPAPHPGQLARILCVRTERVLRSDNTVRYEGRIYLMSDRLDHRNGKTLTVEERIDGKTLLRDGARLLAYREVREQPRSSGPREAVRKRREPFSPAKDHPWRVRTGEHASPNHARYYGRRLLREPLWGVPYKAQWTAELDSAAPKFHPTVQDEIKAAETQENAAPAMT